MNLRLSGDMLASLRASQRNVPIGVTQHAGTQGQATRARLRVLERVGVLSDPLAEEVVQSAVLFHGGDGLIELLAEVAALPDAHAKALVEGHLGADDC